MSDNRRLGPSNDDGFSLVELLVAISVFGVFLVATTGVFISAAQSIGDQRQRTAATRVATDRLETLRGLPYDQLDAQAGTSTQPTPDGRLFTIGTVVARIDAATGASDAAGRLKQITVTVSWTSGGRAIPPVSFTTAVADDPGSDVATQTIGTITMFPSPATTDATGRPLADIDVTVPLGGFPVGTLVSLSWTNQGGAAGARTLTSTTGLNWLGTIPKEQVIGVLAADGLGEMRFNVSAGTLNAVYDLALQRQVAAPPVIQSATIDHNPITVAKPASNKTCASNNQCENTTSLVFTLTTTGLDPAQDSVVLQFQLHDSTFRELPLAPVSLQPGTWRLTVSPKTTKYLTGTGRSFNFTAIRSADGASAGATVLRNVLAL